MMPWLQSWQWLRLHGAQSTNKATKLTAQSLDLRAEILNLGPHVAGGARMSTPGNFGSEVADLSTEL
jgi:hypothetical protein